MPTKAKKTVEKNEKIELEESSKRAKTSTRKSTSGTKAKKASSKTKATNELKVKSDVANLKPSKKAKSAPKKETTTTKKKTASTGEKTTTRKKSSTTRGKTTVAKKTTTKKRTTPKKASVASVLDMEYYDLPYRYNETIVKVLAQTPKSLFVYWDISDSDRENLVKTFGKNFFNDTIPFLRITNENNGYSFDVDVDDFANGWYVPIADAKCTYSVSLLRKQRPFRNKIVEHEIYVTTSNKIEAPNDHILFEKASPTVLYKNIKSNKVTTKTLSASIYKKSRKAIYGLYEYYKEIYQNEDIDEMFDLNNPSSNNPTSTFK